MIITEDVYLEHFGVKGMRWGVRKKERHPDIGNRKRKTSPQGKKFIRNVAISTGVGVVGGLAVAAVIKRNQNLKLAQIQRSGENIRRMGEQFSKLNMQSTAFSAKMPDGKSVFYGKHAEEAFRKAGAFGAIPLGPIGSTSVSRLRGAIPLPKIR